MNTRIAGGVLGDCLAERRQPRIGRVVMVGRIMSSAGRRGDDVLGCGEVRLARPEGDDIPSLGPQFAGAACDGHRGGAGESGQTLGDTFDDETRLGLVVPE